MTLPRLFSQVSLLGLHNEEELTDMVDTLSLNERFAYSASPFPALTLWFFLFSDDQRRYYGYTTVIVSVALFSWVVSIPPFYSGLFFLVGAFTNSLSFIDGQRCFFWWFGVLVSFLCIVASLYFVFFSVALSVGGDL